MKTELYEKYLLGTLSDPETQTLTNLVANDAQAADELIDFIQETNLMITCADVLESEAVSREQQTQATSLPHKDIHQNKPSATVPSMLPPKAASYSWRYGLAAACMAVVFFTGMLVFKQAKPQAIARIVSTSPGLQVIRGPQNVTLAAEQLLFPGDHFITQKEQSFTFVYLNDQTKLTLNEASDLQLIDSTQGKHITLTSGSLSANVAPQPAGKPMMLATPLTTTLVKGTCFVLTASAWHTHLAVTEGLVQLTRRSDGAAQDVAASQQILATAQNTLAARAIGEHPTPMKHRYGDVLFKDEFDTNLDAFEIVQGTPEAGFKAATGETEQLATLATLGKRGEFFVVWIESFVALHLKQRIKTVGDTYAGLRSRKPIKAKSFVVEARQSLYARDINRALLISTGIEVQETKHLLGDPHALRGNGLWQILRWEFIPNKDNPSSDWMTCHFYGGPKGDQFLRSSLVRAKQKKVLIASIYGTALFDYVIVREILDATDERVSEK